jgi:transcriptional regulator with XRE-family HTH domain
MILLDGQPSTPGQALRRARHMAGLRQTDLAEELCISQHTLSKWEADQGNVTLRNFIAAAHRLGFVVSLRRRKR